MLEVDTDGIITQGRDISARINDRIHEKFRDYPLHEMLRVEVERFDGVIIHAMKNYVLKDGDRILFKGSGFKGRHLPPICYTALHRFARAVFDKENLRSVWSEFSNLREYPLRDFSMNVSLNKRPDQYHADTLYADLAKKLGDAIIWGQDVTYVKTVSGYTPLGTVPDAKLRETIDYKYYSGRIRDVVGRLMDAVNAVEEVQVRKGGRKLKASKTKLHEWM